jgi:hypothetical protein
LSEHSTIAPQSPTIAPASAKDVMPAREQFLNELDILPLQTTAVQFKLAIGSPDDPLEHEADAMADTIMRMPEQNFIQRKCNHCEDEQKLHRKPLASFIQLKESSAGVIPSDAISNQINASKGNGSGMDSNTQSFMQSRFGADFSDVKIHTSGEAIQMNRELNAKAFTTGNDIYFNKGQYQPGTSSGNHLLAHELTHTIQQEGATNTVVQKNGEDAIIEGDEPVVLVNTPMETMVGVGTAFMTSYPGLHGFTIIRGNRAYWYSSNSEQIGVFPLRGNFHPLAGVFALGTDGIFQYVRNNGQLVHRQIEFNLENTSPELQALSESQGRALQFRDWIDIPEEIHSILALPIIMIVARTTSTDTSEEAGGAGGEEEATMEEPSGHEGSEGDGTTYYEYPRLPSTINGLAVQPIGGNGIYQMRMHYSAAAPDLLGQVSWAIHSVSYRWEVWDVTQSEAVQAIRRSIETGRPPVSGTSTEDSVFTPRPFEEAATELAGREEQISGEFDQSVAQERYLDALGDIVNASLTDLESLSRFGSEILGSIGDAFNDGSEREIHWPADGVYIMRCIARINLRDPETEQYLRAPSVATMVVTTNPVSDISMEALDAPDANVAELEMQLSLLNTLPEGDPGRDAIPRLEAQLAEQQVIASGTTIEIITARLATARRRLAETRSESIFISAGLNDPEVRRYESEVESLEEQLELATDRVGEMTEDAETPVIVQRVNAVLVSRVTGETYPLLLQITEPFLQDGHWHCSLSDVTSSDGSRYEGFNENESATGDEAKLVAVQRVLENFARGAEYGEGSLTVRFPANGWFANLTDEQRIFQRNTRLTGIDAARARLQELATMIALLGLIIAAPEIAIVGGVLSGALAAARIFRRVSDGTFRWDTSAVTDVIDVVSSALTIVGPVALISGRGLRGSSDAVRIGRNTLVYLGRAADATESALDVVSIVITDVDLLVNLAQVEDDLANGRITATQARRNRAQLMASGIQANGMAIISHARSADSDAHPRGDESAVQPDADTATGRSEGTAPVAHETIGDSMTGIGPIAGLENVPVIRNAPGLTGNAAHARFRDGRLVLELGPDADSIVMRQHLATLHTLQRYEGVVGYINRLISHVTALLGGGPAFGSRGFEARLDVEKLRGILNDLIALQESVEARLETIDHVPTLEELALQRRRIERDIASVTEQLQHHAADIDSTEAGTGRVAMEDTTGDGDADPGSADTTLDTIPSRDWSHDLGAAAGREHAETALSLLEATWWVNPFDFSNRIRYPHGFDDVMMDADGNIVIVEYKGGDAVLADGQMSRAWVVDVIRRIRRRGPEWDFIANRIESDLRAGTLRGVVISSRVNRGIGDVAVTQVEWRTYPGSPPGSVQPKLFAGNVNDPLENEADAMADKVMRMPEQNIIQRKCSDCEEEEQLHRKPLAAFIQRKETSSGAVASDAITFQINSSRGSGSNMDRPTQSFMQSRFGTDFSNVQIHTGNESVQMNRDLNAKAFTVGNDIYFNEGQYSPNSSDGKHLLAHELTHIIQQKSFANQQVIRRKPDKNILNKKIIKIVAFKGSLDSAQATLSDNSIVEISLILNSLTESGIYIYNYDAGAPFLYRRMESEGQTGGFRWSIRSVYGENYHEAGYAEQVIIQILDGDKISQIASIEALPPHISKFLTTEKGKTGSHEDKEDVINAGFVLEVNGVTEDELLLYEIENQRKKALGVTMEAVSLSEWAVDFVNQRQNNVESALTNRELFNAQSNIAGDFTSKEKGPFDFVTKLLNTDESTLSAIVESFEFELRSNTNAFLSQVLLTLKKIEERFITDSSNAGVGLDLLEEALKPLKLALERKEKAEADYAKLQIDKVLAPMFGTKAPEITDLEIQTAAAKDDFEAKSKYLLWLSQSLKLPILNMKGFDIKALFAEKTAANKQGLLKAFISDSRIKIEEMQESIKDPAFLYKADKMIAFTKDNLKIKKGSFVDSIINMKVSDATEESVWGRILDIASFAAMLIPGGFGIFIRLGLSTLSIGKEFHENDVTNALNETELSSKEGSILSSALAIGGFMFDAGDLAKGALKLAGAGAEVATDTGARVAGDIASDATHALEALDEGAAKAIGEQVDDVDMRFGSDGRIPGSEVSDEADVTAITQKIEDGDIRFGYDGRIRGRTDTEEIGDIRDHRTSDGTPVSGTKPSTDSTKLLELDADGLPKQLTQDHGAGTYKIPPFRTFSEAQMEAAKRTGKTEPHILFVQVEDGGVIIAEWWEVSEVGSLWKRAGDTEQKALSRMNLNPEVNVIMWGKIAPCTHAENGCRNAMQIATTQSGAKIKYMVVREDGKVTQEVNFPLPLSSKD